MHVERGDNLSNESHFYHRPTFGDLLDVRDSRHPILVHMAHNFSKAGRFHKTSPIETTLEVVPNDIVATKEFRYKFFLIKKVKNKNQNGQ